MIPSRNTFPLAQHTHTPRMLILTTSRAHNTPWPTTPQFTQSTEGLHLLQNELKSIQMKILLHSLLINASSKQSLTLEKQNQ